MAEIFNNYETWMRAVLICGPFVTVLLMWASGLAVVCMLMCRPKKLDRMLEHEIRNIIQAEICREAAAWGRAELGEKERERKK